MAWTASSKEPRSATSSGTLPEQGGCHFRQEQGRRGEPQHPADRLHPAQLVAVLVDELDYLDIDHNRGQVVHRQVWTTDAAGIDFPGAAQVFRIRRDVFDLSGQRLSKEIVYGITSLTEATAEAIGRWVRQHWRVENKIHWVRNVVFAEDDQNAYLGSAAHAMALFRNLAIALIRLAGHTQIKRTLEHIAADRTQILPLLAASRP
jgi:predicted transposase YbfD/YdcC